MAYVTNLAKFVCSSIIISSSLSVFRIIMNNVISNYELILVRVGVEEKCDFNEYVYQCRRASANYYVVFLQFDLNVIN